MHTLWRLLGLALLSLGFAQPVIAETEPAPKQIAKEIVARMKPLLAAEQAMDLVFLSGSATISNEDYRLLSAQFAILGISDKKEAQQILARYKKLQGQHIPFRVDPLEIPGKHGARHICVLKMDFDTPYTLESMLAFLRLDSETLKQAGIDRSTLRVSRIYRHIVYHELWHCLDRTQVATLESFAARVEDMPWEKDFDKILPALLTNYAEIGADLFAAAIDIKVHGNTDFIDFLITLRETNLKRKQDIEHYTAPALSQLKDVQRSFFTSASLKQLLALVIEIRRSTLDPQHFTNRYREIFTESP